MFLSEALFCRQGSGPGQITSFQEQPNSLQLALVLSGLRIGEIVKKCEEMGKFLVRFLFFLNVGKY